MDKENILTFPNFKPMKVSLNERGAHVTKGDEEYNILIVADEEILKEVNLVSKQMVGKVIPLLSKLKEGITNISDTSDRMVYKITKEKDKITLSDMIPIHYHSEDGIKYKELK